MVTTSGITDMSPLEAEGEAIHTRNSKAPPFHSSYNPNSIPVPNVPARKA